MSDIDDREFITELWKKIAKELAERFETGKASFDFATYSDEVISWKNEQVVKELQEINHFKAGEGVSTQIIANKINRRILELTTPPKEK